MSMLKVLGQLVLSVGAFLPFLAMFAVGLDLRLGS